LHVEEYSTFPSRCKQPVGTVKRSYFRSQIIRNSSRLSPSDFFHLGENKLVIMILFWCVKLYFGGNGICLQRLVYIVFNFWHCLYQYIINMNHIEFIRMHEITGAKTVIKLCHLSLILAYFSHSKWKGDTENSFTRSVQIQGLAHCLISPDVVTFVKNRGLVCLHFIFTEMLKIVAESE
jgi:hypothetical protein